MKTIAFHSFKGGACRTTTMMNTLPFLAQKLKATAKNPLIVVDADLDSLGITNIVCKGMFRGKYNAKRLFAGQSPKNSGPVTDFGQHEFYKDFVPCGDKFGVGERDILLLGTDDRSGTVKPEAFQKYGTAPLEDLIDHLESQNESNRACGIVFDCASGEQTSAIFVTKTVDIFVMCMKPTYQFRIGTFHYLLERFGSLVRDSGGANDKRIILVPTAVSNGGADIVKTLRLHRMEEIKEQALTIRDNIPYPLRLDFVEDDSRFGIPEVERFKWEETILFRMKKEGAELLSDEKEAYERYKMLAESILR